MGAHRQSTEHCLRRAKRCISGFIDFTDTQPWHLARRNPPGAREPVRQSFIIRGSSSVGGVVASGYLALLRLFAVGSGAVAALSPSPAFGSSAMDPRETADLVCPKLPSDDLFSRLRADVGLCDGAEEPPSEESTLALREARGDAAAWSPR